MTRSKSPDYITTLTHWGAYDLEVDNDKVVKVHIEHTQLLLAFGGLPLKNTQISNGDTRQHVQLS